MNDFETVLVVVGAIFGVPMTCLFIVTDVGEPDGYIPRVTRALAWKFKKLGRGA